MEDNQDIDNNNNHGVKRLYRILEVDTRASFTTIRDAYKAKSLEAHPDRPGGNLERMIELNKAYEVLSHPRRRQAYDLLKDIEDTEKLDLVARFSAFPDFLSSLAPIVTHAVLDRAFSFKAHIIACAIGLRRTSIPPHLGIAHIAAFPLIHCTIDTILSRTLLTRQRHEKSILSRLSPMHVAVLNEVLATLISAPFELGAFRIFRVAHHNVGALNYFTSGGIQRNILAYFQTFIRRPDIYCVLGLILFRLGYTVSHLLLSSLSDFCNHKSMLSAASPTPSPVRTQLWNAASYATYALSYFVPCTLFSIHRLFYTLESPSPVPYLNPDVLLRVGLLQSISDLTFDTIVNALGKSTL
eukprot:gene2500-2847_t